MDAPDLRTMSPEDLADVVKADGMKANSIRRALQKLRDEIAHARQHGLVVSIEPHALDAPEPVQVRVTRVVEL